MVEVGETESRVLDALDERALVQSLVSMVQVPSVTGTDAESDLQSEQARQLRQLGFDVDEWSLDLDELRADPEFPGTEADRDEGIGVVGVLPGSQGGTPALVLQGHVDVVPTGDLAKWRDADPWSGDIRREASGVGGAIGDVLHGRGACDMKAGVAVNLAVARALVDSGIALMRPFAVHTVISEEDGGLGAFATLRRGHTADAAVISEPTSGRIVTANAGALTFRLEVAGRAAHGSTRLEGFSAFEAFLPVHRALGELERERNAHPDPLFLDTTMPYPISIGTVRAGDWPSSVPDLLVAEGRLGVQLGEDPSAARAALERAVDEACRADPWLADHPVEVTWSGGQFGSGWLEPRHPLISQTADAIEATSPAARRPERAAAPYGSDLRLYSGVGGIPTLHYGPGDVRFAHAPREQVSIDEVIDVARALAVLAVRRCGEGR